MMEAQQRNMAQQEDNGRMLRMIETMQRNMAQQGHISRPQQTSPLTFDTTREQAFESRFSPKQLVQQGDCSAPPPQPTEAQQLPFANNHPHGATFPTPLSPTYDGTPGKCKNYVSIWNFYFSGTTLSDSERVKHFVTGLSGSPATMP